MFWSFVRKAKIVIRAVAGFLSRWYIQLAIVAAAFVFGMVGYVNYYGNKSDPVTNVWFLGWDSLYSTVKLFVMAFDAKISEINAGYEWVMHCLNIARWMAVIPAGAVLFHIAYPLVNNFASAFYYWLRRYWSSQVLLFGNNDENKMIYRSCDRIKDAMVICCYGEDVDGLWEENISYFRASEKKKEKSILQGQIDNAIKRRDECTIIINTQDEERNLNLTRLAIEKLDELFQEETVQYKKLDGKLGDLKKQKEDKSEEKEKKVLNEEIDIDKEIKEIKEEMFKIEKSLVTKFRKIKIIVFGSRKYRDVYMDFEEKSYGILKYTNKYLMNSLDFVNKYPLTRYIDHKDMVVDGDICLKKDVELRVLLVGFGDTGQEIFNASVATNQFIEEKENSIPQLKLVQYHIFDRNRSWNNKNLNHDVLRYLEDFVEDIKTNEKDRKDYFELPPMPAEKEYYHLNVNESDFYEKIRRACSVKSRAINYLVISFGDDLENIDLAQKLICKKKEWGLKNLHIFVRVRKQENKVIADRIKVTDANDPDAAYTIFGIESESVFNIKKLLNDSLENMAYNRNRMYVIEDLRKEKDGVISKECDMNDHADFKWYMMPVDKRNSNLYNVYSIRMKLQLMGLDYADQNDGIAREDVVSSNEDYFDIYAMGDNPDEVKVIQNEKLKKVYDYEFIKHEPYYKEKGIRRRFAIQEHYRWNAYMITCGFVPMPISKMIPKDKNDDVVVKDYKSRQHGNLTSFKGLIDFRKRIASATGKTELEEDVIKWDYQFMDNIWWLMDENGKVIYRRKDNAIEE